jgi:hypothetical protein
MTPKHVYVSFHYRTPTLPAVNTAITTAAVLHMMYCKNLRLTLLDSKK